MVRGTGIVCIIAGIGLLILWALSIPPRPEPGDPALYHWLEAYAERMKVRLRGREVQAWGNALEPDDRRWVWAGRLGAVAVVVGIGLVVWG
jgi:hypothetical protein